MNGCCPMPDLTPTPAERLALVLCAFRNPMDSHGMSPCETACLECRRLSAMHAREIASILEERHGGASTTAEWLRGLLLPEEG